MMKWLVDNWTLIVLLGCVVVMGVIYIKQFAEKPTDEQLETIREWLLYAVIQAEKEFGSGTGSLKLSAVYNQFCQVFPELVKIIPFALFSELVDEVLERMKKILEVNKDIEVYVKGENE
jgi:hypothetical protein